MSILLKTHKMLWGRSGNMCAFPDCKKILVIDETSTDDPSVIGEEAHIIAKEKNGPRGENPLSIEQRDMYDNLILLCSVHHKIIDDQVNEYSIDKLHKFKDNHESWVKVNLIFDKKKIKDDEIYATYIEKFISLTDLNNWSNWTSWILGAGEIFPKEQFESLKKLPDYIVSRIWPNRYPMLENAFINFKNVLNDLFRVFHMHSYERPDGYATERFYKEYYAACARSGIQYNEKDERLAVQRYEYHVALIEDFIIELTRAANYICDYVRSDIFEGFRMEEGAILITRGDIFGYQTSRVEYRGDERTERPYKGLRSFMEQRINRDYYVGEGIVEEYFN